MNNLLNLSPALAICDQAICDPLASDHVATEPERFQLPNGFRRSLRSLADMLRYRPSLSQQTIAATKTSDLLRRH